MPSNLLCIPLRVTPVGDLGKQLELGIKQEFFQALDQFERDCQYMQELRSQVALLNDSNLVRSDDLKVLEYYVQLEGLSRKFPDYVMETQWQGSLGYHLLEPMLSLSVAIEKVNVIYQLGAVYSQLTELESHFTGEGLKKICSLFQQAAGCMEILLKEIEVVANRFGGGKKFYQFDLTTNSVNALRYLMEAQAQEAIWQKAVSDEMKASVIAKLAMRTSELFSSAESFAAAKDSVLTLEWVNHIRIKKLHFKAAAYLRISTVCLDNFEYGEQVAYLQVAQKTVQEATKYTKYVPSKILLEDLSGLTETISSTLKAAEKDNDLIYLKALPQEKDLKPIPTVAMVKPIFPPELITPLERTTHSLKFLELLPYIIIQLAQAYRERQDSYVYDNFIKPTTTLNEQIVKFLSERNFPAAIDSIQQPENIPDLIIRHSQEIVSQGGLGYVESIFNELTNLAFKSNKVLDGAKERLDMEGEEDAILRQRYGWMQQWQGRLPSLVAAEELQAKVEKMELYLKQAKEGDGFLMDKYEQLIPYLELYCDGYKSLSKYIPNSTYCELPDGLNNLILDLRSAINEINDLIDERLKYTENLEIKSRENNILEKMIREYKSNTNQNKLYSFQPANETTFESTFTSHLKVFDDDLKFVDGTKRKQQSLEMTIDQLNTRFVEEMGTKYENQRKAALQTLESTYASYLDLVSNLTDGCRFYTDFITKGNVVLRDCDEYVYERRIQGRDLENVILEQQQQQQQQQQPLQQQQPGGHVVEQPTRSESQDRVISPIPLRAPTPLKSPTNSTWNPSKGINFS